MINNPKQLKQTLDLIAARLRGALETVEKVSMALEMSVPQFRRRVRQPSKAKLLTEILNRNQSLDIYELVEKLQEAGYRFVGGDPVGSTRAMIYARPGEFQNIGGLFSLKNPAPKTPGNKRPKSRK